MGIRKFIISGRAVLALEQEGREGNIPLHPSDVIRILRRVYASESGGPQGSLHRVNEILLRTITALEAEANRAGWVIPQ